MKSLIVIAFIASNCLAQGLPTAGKIASIDIDTDGLPDLEYWCTLDPGQGNKTRVGYGLYAVSDAEMLLPSRAKNFFQYGQPISSELLVSTSGVLGLTIYYGDNDLGGWLNDYVNFTGNLNSATDAVAGVRKKTDDGYHTGWVRFTRPDTQVQTPFAVAGWDYNPIPDAPIGAGLPPEISVTTELATDEGGQPVLRVSWHPAVATWLFETTPDLTPPVTWEAYPSGGTSAEIPLSGDDAHRYFRLRRP